jgi:hypothetical protein
MLEPRRSTTAIGLGLALSLAPGQALADGQRAPVFSLATPVVELNSTASDGCPIESPDGLSFFIASNRPGGEGGLDVWAADRDAIGAPWGPPRNLGAPVNTASADFCPTPVFGRWLLFVSERPEATCGGGDIFISRQSPAGGWSAPLMLPCAPHGPNTPGPERSPVIAASKEGTFLFYSTNGGAGDHDIYVSRMQPDGQFGAGVPVDSLNSEYDDFMPNLRAAGGKRFEVVFNSNRPTWGAGESAFGGQDVYHAVSLRLPVFKRVVNLGSAVNTSADETRSGISADGQRLHFGRSGDIFVSERQ